MNKVVLDSSAILAILNDEPGREKFTDDLLDFAHASTVNLAEVHTKLVSRGWPPDAAWEDATSPISSIIPFDENQAKIVGSLVAQTRPLGLSLGDRACLALGLSLGAPVFTAERAWKKLKLSLPIHIIR